MHQRYTALSLALLATTCLLAQPTIDAGNNIPTAGSDYAVSSSDGWDFPGSLGADQLFGFWMLDPTGNRNISYLDPAITSSSALVPGTNLLSTDGGSDTLFWQGDANGLTVLADKSALGFVIYTDPLQELKYPCTLGTTWTDAVNASYLVQGFNVQRTGTIKGVGDAYGTLELPAVELQDILRVRVRRTISDASPIVNIQRITESYYFFSADVRHPVLRLNVDTVIINSGTPAVSRDAAWMYGNGNVSVEDISFDDVRFTAYPNPAEGAVNLSFGSAEHGARSIELMDATGRTVQQLPLVQRNSAEVPAAFDASALSPGLYHIRLIGENGVLGSQRLVVQ